MPEVMGGGEGGGEPVPQPSNDAAGVKELCLQFNGGCGGGAPLAWGPPVNEFGCVDREGHASASAPCGDGGA